MKRDNLVTRPWQLVFMFIMYISPLKTSDRNEETVGVCKARVLFYVANAFSHIVMTKNPQNAHGGDF